MSRKYDLVLLDMDGTIADTDELIIRTMNDLYGKYRDGVKTPIEQMYYFSGPPIRGTIEKEFPNGDIDMLVDEFKKISNTYYSICVSAYPHVVETLSNLKKQGVKLGIVTSKGHYNCDQCIEAIGLKDIVTEYVAGDDVKQTKPNPEGIYRLIEHFCIKDKKKVLYIGDYIADYLVARNAGIDVAMVTWGPRKIDRTLNPDYWIDDFKEVEDIVNGKGL